MVEAKRKGRKLLVASIGVAAVSYVACGGSTTTGTSNHPGFGAGGSGDSGGAFGMAGNGLVANLIAPPDPCATPNAFAINIGPSTPLELTNREYDRTVRDLLGDTSGPSKDFPDDSTDVGFRRDPVDSDPTRVMHYVKAAGDVADAAVTRLDAILPCSPATAGEDACASQFIAAFGRRAFRRALNADDVASFHQAYADARATGDFASGMRALIFTALASPHFYQIEEKGSSSMPTSLEAHALASRLSYFIYRSMPDAELTAAADSGNLSSPDEIEVQVRRMLQDPKAHDGVDDFFREWLRLDSLSTMDKSPDVLASFASIRDSMITETMMFAESIFFGNRPSTELLASTSTFANADIAAIYGVPVTGTGFQAIRPDPSVREGLLTQPSILSLTSGPEQPSPTLRGRFVREALLCQPVPPPPPTPDVFIAPVTPGVTNRQRYEMAVGTSPACAPCHLMMDPIGYGFEEFDAVGRYRTMDNGLPVDSSGTLLKVDGGGPFRNAVDLANMLATNATFRACLGTQWLRFALAHTVTETDDGQCLQQTTGVANTMTDIVVAIAKSPAFRYARW